MTATALGVSKEHITKTPGVCGGKACIAGTRIAVWIIIARLQTGATPDEIATIYQQSLTIGDVHAAIAYYHDNTDEIEAIFESNRKLAEIGKTQPSKIKGHLRKQNPEWESKLETHAQ